MSLQLILRLTVMLLAAGLGYELGVATVGWWAPSRVALSPVFYQYAVAAGVGLCGYAAAPHLTEHPYHVLRRLLGALPARTLTMGAAGALFGLLLGALLAIPLSLLPGVVGSVLPTAVALVLGALGATTLVVRDRDLLSFLGLYVGSNAIRRKRHVVLLDTSVIIDGRVADVARTGFIDATIVVPRFVLEELQHIADSPEVLRRNRGRRGLDILNRLQKDDAVRLEVSEIDAAGEHDVDSKLVAAARRLDCPILTNDYNLNRVAELQGVRVLNINELANAVKVVLLPGEALTVQIIQDGKEVGQGVAYLDDGTMVVVEDGRRHMGEEVEIVVTRVLQTVAGRMVFGHLNGRRERAN